MVSPRWIRELLTILSSIRIRINSFAIAGYDLCRPKIGEIDELENQDAIDKGIVAGHYDLPCCLICEKSSNEVGCITQTPFQKEIDRQSSCRSKFVVFIYLRKLSKEPCQYAQTAQYRRE